MLEKTRDEKIEELIQNVEMIEDEVGIGQLEILQRVNGYEQGLIDWYCCKIIGNYNYDLDDVYDFVLGEDQE